MVCASAAALGPLRRPASSIRLWRLAEGLTLLPDPSAAQTALLWMPAPLREPGSSRMAFQPPHHALPRSTRPIAHQRRMYSTWIGAAILEHVQLEYCRRAAVTPSFVGMPAARDAPSASDASLPPSNSRRSVAPGHRKPQPEGRLRSEVERSANPIKVVCGLALACQ